MITRQHAIENDKMRWEEQYATGFRNVAQLLEWLGVDPERVSGGIDSHSEFPLRVPLAFAQRMQRGNPEDPLLLQVLPQLSELTSVSGYVSDPLNEADYSLGSGIIRKYHGRALVVATGACAVHCRYCFRRHYPYSDEALTRERTQHLIHELKQMPDLDEVILSGGDPLSLSDDRLEELLLALADLPQLQRLRIHTRLPIVLPDRVTDQLTRMLKALPVPVACVVHANHAHELGPEVGEAMRRLRDAGVTLLNQSVLLKNINNSPEDIELLCKKGFDIGLLPYYLHQLDAVAGAHEFAVSDTEAVKIHQQLLSRLPGYLVPRLVRERAGGLSKEAVFL